MKVLTIKMLGKNQQQERGGMSPNKEQFPLMPLKDFLSYEK